MGKRVKEDEKQDRRGWLVLLLLLLVLFFAGVAAWAVFFRPEPQPPEVVLTPDKAPEQPEENAEPIPGDKPNESPASKGGSVTLTYSDQVTIDLSREDASLLFANPGRSSRDLVLQIVVQENILAQSGTLEPGNQVKTLSLLPGAAAMLSPGGYEGNFMVHYYDRITGAREVVNTAIPIFITVKK